MTVNEIISELEAARDLGMGDEHIGIVHASSGDPEHKVSARFRLLQLSTDHGVNFIESNYVERFVPAVFPDLEKEP